MTIDKDNSTWKLAEKAVSPANIPERFKVSSVQLEWADNAGRKKALSNAFSKTFRELEGKHEGNYTCFNADHADLHPSMVFDHTHGRFHCYGCMDDGINFDVFDVIKEAYVLQTFPECFRKAIDLFADQPDYYNPVAIYANQGIQVPKAMLKTMYNPYYHKIQTDIYGLEYMKNRGISNATAIRHGLMTWEYRGWWFIVFINDNGTVVRRRFAKTDDARGYADEPPKWWNQNGKGGFFNQREVERAKAKSEIVFVTESAIDALSLAELGFHAVGLNSANRFRKFHEETNYPYLCALFDNDETGRSKAELVKQYGYFTYTHTDQSSFLSQHKDVNDALVADPMKTRADLDAIQYAAEQFYGL